MDISLCADSDFSLNTSAEKQYYSRRFEDRRELSQDQATSLTGKGAFIICMVRSVYSCVDAAGNYKAESRGGHVACTLRVHPPTPPVPSFLLTQNLSPKNIV